MLSLADRRNTKLASEVGLLVLLSDVLKPAVEHLIKSKNSRYTGGIQHHVLTAVAEGCFFEHRRLVA